MTIKNQGIRTSYLIGAPTGLITILITFLIPALFTGEGLATMLIGGVYGKAILGLLFSFIIALGVAGHLVMTNLKRTNSLLEIAFKYSLTVNSIIWAVFLLLTVVDNFTNDLWLYLIPPLLAFLICTTMTTFTLGLMICYIIKKKVTNKK